MTPGRRPAPSLVLAALAAVFAVGLVPRGVVRAIAAQHVFVPTASSSATVSDPGDRHLPGVRAWVAREEDGTPLPPPHEPAAVPAAPAGARLGGPVTVLDDVPAAGATGEVATSAAGRAPPDSV